MPADEALGGSGVTLGHPAPFSLFSLDKSFFFFGFPPSRSIKKRICLLFDFGRCGGFLFLSRVGLEEKLRKASKVEGGQHWGAGFVN